MPEMIQNSAIQNVQMSQFKRENERLIAVIGVIFTLGLAAMGWYMNTLNTTMGKQTDAINDMRTEYKANTKENEGKFNIHLANQNRFDAELRTVITRFNMTEKEVEVLKLQRTSDSETIKRLDLLISDKRTRKNPL